MNGIDQCKAMIFAAGLGTRLKPYHRSTSQGIGSCKWENLVATKFLNIYPRLVFLSLL